MARTGAETGRRRTPSAGDAMVDEMVRRLVEAYRPERVYLFGSVARADADWESDYDILLVVPDDSDEPRRQEKLAYEILGDMGMPVDVVVYTASGFYGRLPLKASLPFTVMREGKLLYAA